MPALNDDRLPPRFWSKVVVAGKCWIWTAGKGHWGYGIFHIRREGKKRQVKAHRYAYETLVGKVPEGLELDHTCRISACVNPACLEPVTHLENIRRWSRTVTHCPYGHEYTEANIRYNKGLRGCRACEPRKRELQRLKKENTSAGLSN